MEDSPLIEEVTVGQRGTVVVSASIRRELGIECGTRLIVAVDDGELRLIPVPQDPFDRLAWAGRGLFKGDADRQIRELRDEWRDSQWAAR